MSSTAGNRTGVPWPKGEIAKIAAADDLHVSPLREDAQTYGTPTWIWSVAVDDALYVRAYNGTASRWYQAAATQEAGRIAAAGLVKDVVFAPINGPLLDRIDEAYRVKYRDSRYLKSMIGDRARAATMEIRPRRLAGHSHNGRDR
jgi:hypothetical protein